MKSWLMMIPVFIGCMLGWLIHSADPQWLHMVDMGMSLLLDSSLLLYISASVTMVLVAWSISVRPVTNAVRNGWHTLDRMTLFDLLVGLLGATVGMLLVQAWAGRPDSIFAVVVHLLAGLLGAFSFYRKREEFRSLLHALRRTKPQTRLAADVDPEMDTRNTVYKILDTSVIIDGRIADLCKTGFIEGTVVIPEFVLEELQHIADSADLLKRNRGRRGLDILNKMQKEWTVPVLIHEARFDETSEVDSKLVKLAKQMGGKLVTNDFNLNKVCELQGVGVLNINDLANAIKPIVLPGEEMNVSIVKDGKESGQGVAYLDDGTMIVVEGGKEFMGGALSVIVTSVLQTSAGRMIFARPKWLEKAL